MINRRPATVPSSSAAYPPRPATSAVLEPNSTSPSAAPDSERILQSDIYSSRASAQNGAHSVKTNSGNDARYERLTARDGKPYFVLRGANHEPIGTSEMHDSTSARADGIASCGLNGPTAEIVDQS